VLLPASKLLAASADRLRKLVLILALLMLQLC
jgi:hypothetical protein